MKRSITTTNSKEAQKHLKQSTSMGGKIGFVVNGNEIIELLYKSQPKLKDIQQLINLGFTQFVYTFAFLPFEKNQITKTIDLMSNEDVLESFEYMSQF